MARFNPNKEVDFLVVGSGISGGIMAKQLSSAGFDVVVLEQGDYLREKDFRYDQLKRTSHSSILATDGAPLDSSRLAVACGVRANSAALTLSCAATAGAWLRSWSAVKATSREFALLAFGVARLSAAETSLGLRHRLSRRGK